MRGRVMFLGGLAIGYVLGARAGRERYDQLVRTARKVRDNPTVQEAAGVVQEQTSRLVTVSRDTLSDKLSHTRFADSRIGERVLSAMHHDGAGAHAMPDGGHTERPAQGL